MVAFCVSEEKEEVEKSKTHLKRQTDFIASEAEVHRSAAIQILNECFNRHHVIVNLCDNSRKLFLHCAD